MSHLHSIYDTDLHFIVDPISRKITSESGKVTLMQNDHLAERFTFEIPRYIEGHDMSLTDEVQIHYLNTHFKNKTLQIADVFIVDDLQISPDSDDMVICSWLISKNATTFEGALHFALRFVCHDDDTIAYQWFTDVFTGIKIAASIYNADVLDDTYNIDIVECWKRDIIKAFEESEPYATVIAAKDEVVASVESAITSAANALVSETNATASEMNAATSETNAATSETNALTSEMNAAASATAASVSEVNAEASAESAEASATEAKYHADVSMNARSEVLTVMEESRDLLTEAVNTINETKFSVNVETGNLEVTDPNRNWTINPGTGNLEWEVI